MFSSKESSTGMNFSLKRNLSSAYFTSIGKTAILCFLFFWAVDLKASVYQAPSLYIGASTIDITPTLPVALDGQMHVRIAKAVETPLTANVVVMETRDGDRTGNVTTWVSCDLVTIPTELLDLIRQSIAKRLPNLDPAKIIVNATHTHTAGVVRDGWYLIPEGVTQVKEYQGFIADQVTTAIENAWADREKASMSWGLDYAKVAYNRRAVFADGTAQMYGKTDVPEFRRIEGVEDQGIQSLFFWNDSGKLIATCINVSSPAQVVESRSAVNADYWHPVREALKKELGKDLVVLGWIGAAGDQAPRPMYDHRAETRMLELRAGNKEGNYRQDEVGFRTDAYLQEIARRIVAAVMETHDIVKNDRRQEVLMEHRVARIELPMRTVTEAEVEAAQKMRDEDVNDPEKAKQFSRRIAWQQEVVDRFERQHTDPAPIYPSEIHVMRLGDLVICTNPFELYTDFGVQIKSRSKALQTFVIQLVGPGTYVPTEEAVNGGHYSAIVQSNRVGPEGGQMLVESTVSMINELF